MNLEITAATVAVLRDYLLEHWTPAPGPLPTPQDLVYRPFYDSQAGSGYDDDWWAHAATTLPCYRTDHGHGWYGNVTFFTPAQATLINRLVVTDWLPAYPMFAGMKFALCNWPT